MTAQKNDQDQYDEFTDEIDPSDHSDSYQDDLDADAEWDEGEQTEDTKPRKKKSGSFNLIVIVLGVLLFVGFVYFKMAAPTNKPEMLVTEAPITDEAPTEQATAPDAASEAESASAPAVPEGTAATEQPATATSEASEEAKAAEQAMTPMPNFTIDTSDASSATVTAEPGAQQPEIIQAEVEPEQATVPQSEQTPDQAVVPVQPNDQPDDMAVAPVPDSTDTPVPAMTIESQLDVPNETVSDDRLQKIESEMSALRTAVETQAQHEGSSAELLDQLKALNTRLDRLENRVAETKAVPATPVKKAEKPAAGPHPKETSSEKDPSAGWTVTTVLPDESATSSSGSPYRLKAVSKGKAYLSQPGHSGLVTARVGDQIEGLGRILSIEQTSGRWVVTGTVGRVRQ